MTVALRFWAAPPPSMPDVHPDEAPGQACGGMISKRKLHFHILCWTSATLWLVWYYGWCRPYEYDQRPPDLGSVIIRAIFVNDARRVDCERPCASGEFEFDANGNAKGVQLRPDGTFSPRQCAGVVYGWEMTATLHGSIDLARAPVLSPDAPPGTEEYRVCARAGHRHGTCANNFKHCYDCSEFPVASACLSVMRVGNIMTAWTNFEASPLVFLREWEVPVDMAPVLVGHCVLGFLTLSGLLLVLPLPIKLLQDWQKAGYKPKNGWPKKRKAKKHRSRKRDEGEGEGEDEGEGEGDSRGGRRGSLLQAAVAAGRYIRASMADIYSGHTLTPVSYDPRSNAEQYWAGQEGGKPPDVKARKKVEVQTSPDAQRQAKMSAMATARAQTIAVGEADVGEASVEGAWNRKRPKARAPKNGAFNRRGSVIVLLKDEDEVGLTSERMAITYV